MGQSRTYYWLYGDANAEYKTPNRFELLSLVTNQDVISKCGIDGATGYSLHVAQDLITGEQSAKIDILGQDQTLATYTGNMFPRIPETRHYPGGFTTSTEITVGFSSFTNLETGDVLFPNGFRLMACIGEGVFEGGTKVIPGYGYFFCSGDYVYGESRDPNVIESWSVWTSAAIMPLPLPNSVALSLSGIGLLGFLRHLARRRRNS